ESIKNATKIGSGLSITRHAKGDEIESSLSHAISKFCSIDSISEHIPECQTNFVYSSSNPSSLKDVMGLEGRIVRTGEIGTVAGNLRYGGSKHVASAVLEVAKKFSSIRSGVNLKYDNNTIKKAISKGMKVSSYDRKEEPLENKKKDGHTVPWGISTAIASLKTPPDIIFH
ncbi:MAG: bifunctional hydroxymethylpyrimidine kinase/phosphomethylpyrimidine kinase, partial [Thaumarchaeota archaeon]|nr:bifunctional hydroxymethylpyrimidine kinase/phosphomethylpyrimidine kinase [Nitrososphaerota archaeon]